jgi:hypothetical protein
LHDFGGAHTWWESCACLNENLVRGGRREMRIKKKKSGWVYTLFETPPLT